MPPRPLALSALAALGACAWLAPRRAAAQTGQAPVVVVGAADSAAHLYRGDRSGFADAARLVVRDAGTWRRVWATLAAGRADSLAPPAVDFRRELLIVAALGARPTGGYEVAIDTVRRGELVIEAVVRSVVPGPSCARSFALVQPVDVVRVPHSQRPVAFVEQQVVRACGTR